MKRIGILGALALFLAGCSGAVTAENTDEKEKRQTAQMQAEASRQAGLPNITSFTEKKNAKLIYELRDKEIATYSYFMDFQGRLMFLCESIGFGLPFSVQYVSPEKTVRGDLGSYYGDIPMPQTEPNGLFMPDSLSATWVLCSDGEGGFSPVYSEPSLIVSPFRLKHTLDLRRDAVTASVTEATWEGDTPVGQPEE